MTSLRNYFGFLLISTLIISGACGGGESRPGPLKHHLDDMFIAQIPIAEQQSVIQAQQDHDVAKREMAKAKADLNDANTELKVAENERKQTLIDEQTAKTRRGSAEKTGDLNRINAASNLQREAEMARKAADKKVEYMKARRDYLKKYVLHTEDNVYAMEARYELSKARLAQSKNIRPRGMVMANYERQAQERVQFAKQSESEIKAERANVERLRKEWKGLAKESGRPAGKDPGTPETPTTREPTNTGTTTNTGAGGTTGSGSGAAKSGGQGAANSAAPATGNGDENKDDAAEGGDQADAESGDDGGE